MLVYALNPARLSKELTILFPSILKGIIRPLSFHWPWSFNPHSTSNHHSLATILFLRPLLHCWVPLTPPYSDLSVPQPALDTVPHQRHVTSLRTHPILPSPGDAPVRLPSSVPHWHPTTTSFRVFPLPVWFSPFPHPSPLAQYLSMFWFSVLYNAKSTLMLGHSTFQWMTLRILLLISPIQIRQGDTDHRTQGQGVSKMGVISRSVAKGVQLVF